MEKHSKRQEYIATMEIQPSQDVELVAQNNEQFGSPDGRDIENRLPSPRDDENNPNEHRRSLYESALKDNWREAEQILNKCPRIAVEKITEQGETVLHIATKAKSIRLVGVLMKVMEVSDLELKDKDGYTAFYHAANFGFIEIAKAMVERNDKLPNIPCGSDEEFPIKTAAAAGYKAMASYLLKVTSLDKIDQDDRLLLLDITIQNEMFEAALNIFNNDKQLTNKILQGDLHIFYWLSQKSLAISNQEVKSKRKFTSAISMSRSRFITRVLPERYVLKKQAGLLLEKLWAECVKSSEKELVQLVIKKRLLHWAARAGNVEFVAVVIRSHPELIWQFDDQNWTAFHVAVLYRQEEVFSLIHQIEGLKSRLHLKYDNDGNNILHLAGKLGYSNLNDKYAQEQEFFRQTALDSKKEKEKENLLKEKQRASQIVPEKIMPPSFLKVSAAALQMQREILWFEEVEKLVPLSHRNVRNKEGKTARELFTEEHKQLVKEGERWMKDTANSCMIVATLIATMVFAAGFTVPGGNNDDNGIPILLKLNGFRVFVISNAVALFSSISSIIMFLSILTSRYAEDDFRVSLPTKLRFGLIMLLVSIVSMPLAFTATFFLFYGNHISYWEPKLIAACACVPVALFGCLHYKLWFDVVKSTYRFKFLFRSAKYKLY